MGLHEVTQREYEQVMRKTPSHFSKSGGGFVTVGRLDTARFPVESVSWDDCQEFIKRLNEMTREKGWEYRLPTLLQWQ